MHNYIDEILATIEECIIVVDKDYRLEKINTKTFDLFKLHRQDIIGREFKEFFTCLERNCLLDRLVNLKVGEEEEFNNFPIEANNVKKYISGKLRSFSDEEGEHIILIFNDTSLLNYMEEELASSENKFRSLYNSLLTGYTLRKILYNADGEPLDYLYLETNPAYQIITGKNREEIIGKTYLDLYKDNDSLWLDLYHKVAKSGKTEVFESYVESLDKYLRASVFKVSKDEIGVITEDITKQKALEKTLESEREFFKRLFSSVQNGYAYCEIVEENDCLDFKYLEVNPTFLKFTKSKYEDVINNVSRDVYPHGRMIDSEKTDRVIKLYRDAAFEGSIKRFDIYSNVMMRDIEIVVYGFGDGTFTVEYIDISERISLRNDLEAEKEKFFNLFDKMHDAFALLEVDCDDASVKDIKVLEINPACEAVTGLDASKIEGKRIQDIFENTDISQSSYNAIKDIYLQTLVDEKREVRGYRKAFDRYFYVTSFLVDDNKLAVIMRDFTKQKELEDDLFAEKEQFRLLFENTLSGFALHEVIFDDGKAVDFITRKANPAFLELGYQNADKIINIKASDYLEIKNNDWPEDSLIHDYGYVAKTGLSIRKEYYTRTFDKYVDIAISKVDDSYVAVAINDITERKKAEESLEWNLEVLKQAQAIALLGSFEFSFADNSVWLSEEARMIHNITKERISVEEFLNMIKKDDKESFLSYFRKIYYRTGKEVDHTYQVEINQRKKIKHIHMRGIVKEDTNSLKIIGVFQDISDYICAQEDLVVSELKYRKIIESASDIMIIYDRDLNVNYRSPNIERILGWSEQDFDNFGNFSILHPNDIAIAKGAMRDVMSSGLGARKQFEVRVRAKSGEYRETINTVVNLLEDPHINGLLINYIDVTELKEKEREIKYLNEVDTLTGLYSRKYFENKLDDFDEEENLPLAVIMADLNGLKLTNDMFGQSKGDQVLSTLGTFIKSACDDNMIPIRFGGDEFCTIVKNADSKRVESFIEELQSKYEDFRRISNNELFYPSISLGYKIKNSKEKPLDQIIREAEEKMYDNKLFENQSIHSASSLIASIKTALHEKSFETEEHSDRMAKYSKEIGKCLGLSDSELQILSSAAELHDIGKIGIDNSILTKESDLTEEEWEVIERHPEIGFRIAQSSGELSSIAEYILYHHERYDGKGYPAGLEKEEIPLYSRIIAIADAFDVMITDRPYRKKMSLEKAIEELEKNKGSQFDPKLVDMFINEVVSTLKIK